MDSDSNSVYASVVIPVFNHKEHLRGLLKSIKETFSGEISFEVIVVDDGSEDDLKPMLDDFQVRHHRLDVSQGPANARNIGAEMAKGEVIFFFDADVVCPTGLLEKAKSILDDSPDIAAVSFLNQPYDPNDCAIANYVATQESFWFLAILEGDCDVAETPSFMTRGGVIRKSAFQNIGGFDTSYMTNAHEDYDFGKRLAAQYKSVLVREPILYHNYPTRLGKLMRNYWVRVVLFVPYCLRYKPELDKTQVSSSEGLLRLLGSTTLPLLASTILPYPFGLIGLGLLILVLISYLFGTRRFLYDAWKYSRGISFPAIAFFIHLLSSYVITLGSFYGLLRYLAGKDKYPLKSTLKQTTRND